ncbi:hypothetical protein Pmani_032660 [Petrolisthes manimaculis]|uniref:Uncharacterized protein n=1 Tax=Petrolisthes manimaculis TaxID=1843537 RepID=A0AAE1TR87_9EUCA|nr:hypothetical protein Pmani_032660 [Petrolisthes manimaculis]
METSAQGVSLSMYFCSIGSAPSSQHVLSTTHSPSSSSHQILTETRHLLLHRHQLSSALFPRIALPWRQHLISTFSVSLSSPWRHPTHCHKTTPPTLTSGPPFPCPQPLAFFYLTLPKPLLISPAALTPHPSP